MIENKPIKRISYCSLLISEGFNCGSCPAIDPKLCHDYYYPKTEQEYNKLMEKIRK